MNEYLLNFGGHIGYGIRPSKRGNGYAKTIEGCGGKFENEVLDESNIVFRRYWLSIQEY